MERWESAPSRDELRGGRHRHLGYRVVEMDRGTARLEWTPDERIANPTGYVHGGYVAAIVDDTAGVAVASLLDELHGFPTVSMHVEFLRGIQLGRTHACHGVVVRAGRSLTVADAEIRSDEGELLARGTCEFALDLRDSDLAGFSALPPRP